MTRRDLLALLGSAAVLKGQNCAIPPPQGFVGPVPSYARAESGFIRPYNFPQLTQGVINDGNVGFGFNVNTDIPVVDVYGSTCPHIWHPGKDINYTGQKPNPTSTTPSWDDFMLPVYACADGVVCYVRPAVNPSSLPKIPGSNASYPQTVSAYVIDQMNGVFGSSVRYSLKNPPPQAVLNNLPPYNQTFLENVLAKDEWVGLIIKHNYLGKVYYSLYGHVVQVNRTAVQLGQTICQATQVAAIGTVGAQFSHLHFEIRYGTYSRAGDYTDFCTNTNPTNVAKYHADPVNFVIAHPSYTTIITNEIQQSIVNYAAQKNDTRFGSSPKATGALQFSGPVPTYPTLEVRVIPYAFSNNRTVQVYHYLDPRNEQARFPTFWDPDSNQPVALPVVHLD